MDAVKKLPDGLRRLRYARRCRILNWIPTLFTGSMLPLAGCVVFAASAGAALLTGLFVGRLNASLAATANSYRYSDVGDVGLVFRPAPVNTPSLVRFVGRLPGFHIVFVNLKEAGSQQAQTGDDEFRAIVYDTDVEIDFSTSPPRLTGEARPRDGGEAIPIEELYPDISSLSVEISEPDEDGSARLELRLRGTNDLGDEIEYALILGLQPSAGQSRLEGLAQVERTFTPDRGEPETVTGSGSLAARRTTESGIDDVLNDNDDSPPPANDNASNENENRNENRNVNQNDNDEPPPPPPSACIPGLSTVAAGAVDLFIEAGGEASLDLNQDGVVSTGEVQDSINPVLNPYGFAVSNSSAACIAELLNEP